MRSVVLHGTLREQFGGPFKLHCNSVVEAVRLLVANFPQLPAAMAEGTYRVSVGRPRRRRDLDETEIPMHFPEDDNIHIIPAIAGAKRGGGKLIAGIAILAVTAIATGGFSLAAGSTVLGMGGSAWGSIAMVGASLALSGIAQMLTPVPKTPSLSQNERPEDRPSFMLGGAVNVVEQGHPIPICGGENILGGIVVSVGFNVERIPI